MLFLVVAFIPPILFSFACGTDVRNELVSIKPVNTSNLYTSLPLSIITMFVPAANSIPAPSTKSVVVVNDSVIL